MPTAVPVSYRDKAVINAARFLGLTAVIIGAGLAAHDGRGERFAAYIFGAVGATILVVNEIVAAITRPSKRSVIDTGSGFRWLENSIDENVDDNQVTAIQLKQTSKYSSGILKAVVRQFDVWVDGRDQPYRMCNRIAVDATDPIAELIDRVIMNFKHRTAAALADENVLNGDGWQLAAAQLSIKEGKQTRDIPLAEVVKVAMFDGKHCIWIEGENEPAAKIDPKSKNAVVLGSLLAEWTEHRNVSAAALDDAGLSNAATGLGRLLFERRNSEVHILCVMFGLMGIALGAILLADPKTVEGGLLTIAISVALVACGFLFGRQVFRCYEIGLTRQRGKSKSQMNYAEIVEFNYGATRVLHNGVYAGTSIALSFRSPTSIIRYKFQIKNSDDDIEKLRDHIASLIARRMFDDVRASKVVPWGSDATFLPVGLKFRLQGIPGASRGSVDLLPYGQIAGVNVERGVFYIYRTGETKPVFSKQVASANFFPGFYLLRTLLDISRQVSQNQ